MMPAAADRWRTAKASSGVGRRRGSTCTRMPAPASTAAVSPANPSERCLASQPTTTPASAAPGSCSRSHQASAAVAPRTTARFILPRPAPTAPRSPAVPKASRAPKRPATSALAAGPPSSSAASSARSPGSGSSSIQASAWARRSAEIISGDSLQDLGEQRAHPGRGRRPYGDDLLVLEPVLADAGGEVRDQRDGQHLRAEVTGRDCLEDGGHPDQVRAEGAEHGDLGRGLVVRAGQRGVDALGNSRVHLDRYPAQPRRVQVAEVDEPRQVTARRGWPGGGGLAGEFGGSPEG